MSTFVKGAKVKEQHTPEPVKLEGQRTDIPSGSNVVGTGNDARLKMYDDIADRADELRAPDLQDLDGESVRAKRPVEDEESPTERVEAREPEEPRRFKIKVNGSELELSESELIERAQKVESADRYLQDAAEAVRNASRLASPPKEDEPAQVEEDDLALARALQMGSEEDAAKAIRKIRARPSEVTPDVLPKLVDERLQFLKAVESFNVEYKDYLEVPALKQKAHEIDARLAQSEPSLPYADRLKRVGEEVKREALSIVQKFGSPKTDKAARKASVAPVPSAAGRQSQMSDDEGEESPESVIAAMAKTRGQGRPISH